MISLCKTIGLRTKGFCDIIDITGKVAAIVSEAGLVEGTACVFCHGSTGAVSTIEFETGVINDLKRAIEQIAPSDDDYEHNERWGDGNGFSHVRAALLKPSLTVPVSGGSLCLGTWQQLVFIDFDNRNRDRNIIVQLMGLN